MGEKWKSYRILGNSKGKRLLGRPIRWREDNIEMDETWSLTLREEHRQRVFENRVLRRIFGTTTDEVTGEWRKLHNEELHDLYSSPHIIRIMKARRMSCAGHVARKGEKWNAYRLLVGKPEGARPLERRRRWVDNIKMDLGKIGWDGVD
jgi:hypothetical protein